MSGPVGQALPPTIALAMLLAVGCVLAQHAPQRVEIIGVTPWT
jgi:hypothetical protein